MEKETFQALNTQNTTPNSTQNSPYYTNTSLKLDTLERIKRGIIIGMGLIERKRHCETRTNLKLDTLKKIKRDIIMGMELIERKRHCETFIYEGCGNLMIQE